MHQQFQEALLSEAARMGVSEGHVLTDELLKDFLAKDMIGVHGPNNDRRYKKNKKKKPVPKKAFRERKSVSYDVQKQVVCMRYGIRFGCSTDGTTFLKGPRIAEILGLEVRTVYAICGRYRNYKSVKGGVEEVTQFFLPENGRSKPKKQHFTEEQLEELLKPETLEEHMSMSLT